MEKIEILFKDKKFSHHTYGVESHGLKIEDFEKLIDKNRFSCVFARHYDFFKVDDAREIKLLQSEKTDKESLFIISFTHINNETQNTLLKMLEEPNIGTTFFFIFPNSKNLLETVLSRMELIFLNRVLDTEARKINFKDFLECSLIKRFDFIKEITNKKKSDQNKFLKSDLQGFLDDLEIFFIRQKPNEKRNDSLKNILLAREYMKSNSSSLKMILDMLAINL